MDKVCSEDKSKEDNSLKLNKFAKPTPWNNTVGLLFGFLCIML